MKYLLDAVIFSNCWISLGAVMCTLSTFLYNDQQIQYEYLLIIFLMTFFGYNIQMSSNPISSNIRSNQTNWLIKHGQKMKYLSYILFVISIPIIIVTFSFDVLIFSLPAFIAVVMYKSKDYTSFGLRTIPSLKLILIALIWSWVCVVTPQLLFFPHVDFSFSIIVFSFILAITIPFDIRDLNFDSENLKTLPQIFGSTMCVLIALSILLALVCYSYFNLEKVGLCYLFTLTALFILPSYKARNEYYYLFLIDGFLVLFPIFVM
tara:strand:+ start:1770 stop:2558 length:789 start_codon:yes stop_codon:yes gene_type:complete